MKLLLTVVCLFTLSVVPVIAQQNKMTPDLRRATIDEVKISVLTAQLATAQSQLAASQSQVAQMVANQKQAEAQALIDSTQKALGLDATYAWDFQAQDYLKKPAPQPAK